MQDIRSFGQYYRTSKGRILKCARYESPEGKQYQDRVLCYSKEAGIYTYWLLTDEKLLKHSPNIVDIIEVRRLRKWKQSYRNSAI